MGILCALITSLLKIIWSILHLFHKDGNIINTESLEFVLEFYIQI